jgi:two-component system sensor histidine kinase TctE
MRPEPGQAPQLRAQLIRGLLLPLLALLAADAVISYHVANGFAQRAYDKALVDVARELTLQVRANGPTLWLDLPDSARRILLEDALDTIYYELADRDGHRVIGEDIAAPALARGATTAAGDEVLYDSAIGSTRVRAVQVRLREPEGAIVRVAETRAKRDELAGDILASVVFPQVLLIVLAATLVWFGVRRGLEPLEELQRAIAARSHRDRSPLDVREVPGEVRPLVVSINALLGRLDSVLDLQSRFIADAAHQLKTPVAGLKAQVELLDRAGAQADAAEIRGQLHVGVERLSRLVSQLLALARNEPDAVRSLAFETLDLNALVLDIATHWVPLALKHGLDLGFEGSERAVVVSGDAGRLRELFDNLVDNAIRYSKAGGRVTVRVRAAPAPSVSISDDGPRIAEADRRRIFERFHRLLGTGDGSGLGLAIAQEIAGLHNARISLRDDDHDGVGNVFTVEFPAGDPTPARAGP